MVELLPKRLLKVWVLEMTHTYITLPFRLALIYALASCPVN